MEAIPVEVIGNILSLIAAARDVAIASTVCKKWRDAARRHLRDLRFSTTDCSLFSSGELSTADLEVLITETILRTSCLANLTLSMGNLHKFSPAPVNLVNVLDRCGRLRLESLSLGYVSVPRFDTGAHNFPLLRSLTLKRVSISSLDINLFLSACPRLASLALINTDPTMTDMSLLLSSTSLTTVTFEALNLDNVHVLVDAPGLEELCIRDCTIEHLEVLKRGSLRCLRMAHCNISQLDPGEATDKLEVFDISGLNDWLSAASALLLLTGVARDQTTLAWSKLHPMLLRANRLRTLRLWASPEVDENAPDTETLALSFPLLTKLSLAYDLTITDGLEQLVTGASEMGSVCTLEVGSDVVNEVYGRWIGALVERCPRVRRLVVYGRLSDARDKDDFRELVGFTMAIFNLMRRFASVHIELQFY